MIKAILAATVLPNDGVFSVATLHQPPDLAGIPHYVGHPSTRAILEGMGSVKADDNLFAGLDPGESAIVCQLAKPRMSGQANKTVEQDITEPEDLRWRLITRRS